jgi:acetyl-CoA carboxylase, biotin carboxylase subunit
VRIIRACRELGIRSVAVYSDADRLAPHVMEADEAYHIGPAPSAESYLRVDKLLDVANRSGAGAVHPGYGFLAERAVFADAVTEAGLVFIGPRAETIRQMGDKTEARQRMQAASVPIVPGVTEAIPDAASARKIADEIGYPVLLRASAGGGGKGMRAVDDPAEVERAFEAASREAQAAFGDGSVYLEKYLARPRHIEIQILGDTHGNVVHLAERECSIQRRHQKLVEEAPSPVLDEATRAAMGAAAVQAAKAVDYRGAGTVEFLYQESQEEGNPGGEFFFLEMNTRIQVEHCVTELVTGLDLLQWQLRVARGESLDFTQDDVRIVGHAIECRITSEDPDNGFLPSTGRIDRLELPAGPGVRWDGGIAEGFEVGLHYDPLLGKLIVHAPTREGAIQRMDRALDELLIRGLETSAPFHRRLMADPDFRSGDLTIRFLEDHADLMDGGVGRGDTRTAAVAAALLEDAARRQVRLPRIAGAADQNLSGWRRAGWPWQTP